MPHRPHINLAGHPQHVVQRVHNCEACFFADEKKRNRLRCLGSLNCNGSELDVEALADIRLALSQGQPLGSERFSEIMCAAVGVRRVQRKPGRPMEKRDQGVTVDDQSDFGF